MAAQVLQRNARAFARPGGRILFAGRPALSVRAAAAAARRRLSVSMAAAAPKVPEAYSSDPDPEIARFQEHQRTAARPSNAEEARTLMALARSATLSTASASPGFEGFPFGSVVEFAVDAEGRPILATSTLSPHTGDLAADGRCSLTVTAPGFQSLQDARFTLAGRAVQLPDAERAAAREAYLAKYPNAFYVDFGDFKWFRLDEIKGGRFVGGFGRVGTIKAEDYAAAKPDPVAAFAAPVCGHMNADHEGDVLAMLKHYVGLTAVKARMLDLDRLGTNLQVTQEEGGASFKVRLPFVRPAEDRKGIKEVIVEMTRAARGAGGSA
ncbi:hypothetical protein Rsub_02439 [Raphidocelis subcapitata]|uniref:Uncharacterized protein n=1 Tax=Raphidocelis subcapitata TaxID=307507 RepID=A0A2V0NXN9_9CHLO|nr:hypothetical protein Rsub_02439 [Raphidocelis subcapitata]|eukprot:GBF90333.1 hypothetical protein Rsub_02439 [Raphidocelis subcapitata]